MQRPRRWCCIVQITEHLRILETRQSTTKQRVMSLRGSLPAEQVDNAVINLPTRGNVNNIKHRILEIDFHNSRSHRRHPS